MNYKESIIDILETMVESMTFPVTVKSIGITTTDGITYYTVTTCDIYHAQVGFYQTINDVSFKITTIDAEGKRITFTTTETIAGDFWDDITTFDLYTPYFFHGTPLAVNNTELQKIPDASNKTPMIWLLRPFRERFEEDVMSVSERESTLRIFFLTQSDRNALTGQVDDAAIEPMHRLMEQFIAKLKTYKLNCDRVFDTEKLEYDQMDYTKFGVYIQERGVEKSLFADYLAGCEMSVVLKLNRLQNCTTCS